MGTGASVEEAPAAPPPSKRPAPSKKSQPDDDGGEARPKPGTSGAAAGAKKVSVRDALKHKDLSHGQMRKLKAAALG